MASFKNAMKKMKKDTEYEKLAQEIYQNLISHQGNNAIKVQHNVKLVGKSGRAHQIDVYWEYEIAGVYHKVLIECKNYTRPVSKGHTMAFHAVLADLNGVNGIMISKVGYQEGAKIYADHYGINLMELRNPNDSDLVGRIKEISIDFVAATPTIKSRIPQVDKDWVLHNIPLPKEGQLKYVLHGRTDTIVITDDGDQPITSFYELDGKIPIPEVDKENCEHVFAFENAYLKLDPIGRIKITGIKYVYDIKIITEELKIHADQITRLILKDTLSGTIKFFDHNGGILG